MKTVDYPFTIQHLAAEDGGGYFIEFPDLPGCMSDDESSAISLILEYRSAENQRDSVQRRRMVNRP